MKGVEYENCKTFLKFKIHWEIKKLHKVLLFKRVTMFWKFLKDAKCAFDLQKHCEKKDEKEIWSNWQEIRKRKTNDF